MPHLQSITTAFYGNYACIDREGRLLFRCDEKKKQWYLSRNLAEMISDDPPTFRLKFEPKGQGHHGDPFFLQDRKNQCVVCGTSEDLTRHHVVPHCYRRFFPKEYNRFGSFDVMMLCEADHIGYEFYSNILRTKLAEEYKAPVSGIDTLTSSKKPDKAISYSFALLRHGEKIPEAKRSIMYDYIKNFLQKSEVSSTDLESLSVTHRKREIRTHGEIVVSQLTDLNPFNIRWRQHFVDTMEPKFLPDYWSVDRIFSLSSD